MIIDIDHFKQINDELGHLVGDDVLRRIAKILKQHSHAQDIIARYGGDEFVLLLNERQHGEVLALAQRIREDIAQAGTPLATCTIGVACHDKKIAKQLMELLHTLDPLQPGAIDFKTLFKAADHSLYIAKQAGRNRVCMNNLLDHTEQVY